MVVANNEIDETKKPGQLTTISMVFRPDLDWSKRCLNLVYLQIIKKLDGGGGAWCLNFRRSKCVDLHLNIVFLGPFWPKPSQTLDAIPPSLRVHCCQTHTASNLTLIQIAATPTFANFFH
jgi:hypothetical protein